MKTIIAIIAFILLNQAAHAQINMSNRRIGNTIYTDVTGPNGYNANWNTRQIGNTIYTDGYDNKGNISTCTTRTIGNTTYTDCN